MAFSSDVCIMGVGFVGLHLVECFSRKHNITAFDINVERITYLQQHHAMENVNFTHTFDDIKKCKLFCVSVPTLLNKTNDAVDLKYVESAIAMLEQFVQPGCTVVLESSVSVGTSRRLLKNLHERGVCVGFSPERVDPGRTEPAAHDIAKVVSGYDAKCLEQIKEWYSTVYTQVVPVSKLETAEMCKLYENCFRMINIAYAFQATEACAAHGIDVNEMIEACDTKPYGFMTFKPSLGVGGTCIPVNPYYLFVNNDFSLLRHATKISENRPIDMAQQLVQKFTPKRVLVIGLAYKPGESITYKSPALPYVEELTAQGVEVHYYDPKVDYKQLTRLQKDNFNSEYLQQNYDAVAVCTKQTDVDYTVLDTPELKKKVVVY